MCPCTDIVNHYVNIAHIPIYGHKRLIGLTPINKVVDSKNDVSRYFVANVNWVMETPTLKKSG